MNRFPNNARVLFIGDSITCGGIWIAHIYDYYLRNFPRSGIRMYNAGISGGSMTSALEYYDRGNGENLKPTHAVIMMGMNDIGRWLYDLKPDEADFADRRLTERWERVTEYEQKLRRLARLLIDRGVKLTFLAPTGIDETQLPRELNTIGCDAGLEYLGELNRRIAEETHSDFINLHAPLRMLNTALTMTRPDRVHPDERGHVCMARAFLASQGLEDEPTPLTLDTLPAWDDLLPENKARFEAEKKLRALWNAEWLILRRDDLKTEDDRRAYLREFRKTAPEGFWTDMIDTYFALNGDRIAALDELLTLTDACAARA